MFKLCAQDLSFSYSPHLSLFSNLSFEASAGKCLYIQGSNGSGKTTLLRILAGLQPIKRGRIFIKSNHKNDSSFSCDYLQTETNGLFANLSAVDNILFWQKACGKEANKEAFFELAKRWGFKNKYALEKLPVKRFSTGMKKKIALMRVFLLEANLLLFDEPLNGLDEASCQFFLEELLVMKKKKKIIVISSHQKLGLWTTLLDQEITL